MEAHERIIFPLDGMDGETASEWQQRLKGKIGLVKIGLELYTAIGPAAVESAEIPVMLDLKLHDIPATMAGATRRAAELGTVKLLTVHASAGANALKGCVATAQRIFADKTKVIPKKSSVRRLSRKEEITIGGKKGITVKEKPAEEVAASAPAPAPTPEAPTVQQMEIVAVTLLTSVDTETAERIYRHVDGKADKEEKKEGGKKVSKEERDNQKKHVIKNVVGSLLSEATLAGVKHIVCSPQEAALVRKQLPEAVIITPGIRLPDDSSDDQARFATPEEAIAAGADYIVVGRPIRNASDPQAVIKAICTGIEAGLSRR